MLVGASQSSIVTPQPEKAWTVLPALPVQYIRDLFGRTTLEHNRIRETFFDIKSKLKSKNTGPALDLSRIEESRPR